MTHSTALATVPARALSGLVDRAEALDMFGATYLHGGPVGQPIVEILGRHARDPDPGLARKCFPSLHAAVEHVRDLARREARTELDHIEAAHRPRGERLGLWVARNWPSQRGRHVAVLATEALREQRKAGFKAILRDGFEPRVSRLPDGIRFPCILDDGTPVWVLDLSHVPFRPIALRRDEVARRTVVNVVDHPYFDALLRYELSETPGRFAFDAVDPTTPRLAGPDEFLQVFLSEDDGRREIARLAESLSAAFGCDLAGMPARIGTGDGPVAALPPAAPPAAPSPDAAPLDAMPADPIPSSMPVRLEADAPAPARVAPSAEASAGTTPVPAPPPGHRSPDVGGVPVGYASEGTSAALNRPDGYGAEVGPILSAVDAPSGDGCATAESEGDGASRDDPSVIREPAPVADVPSDAAMAPAAEAPPFVGPVLPGPPSRESPAPAPPDAAPLAYALPDPIPVVPTVPDPPQVVSVPSAARPSGTPPVCIPRDDLADVAPRILVDPQRGFPALRAIAAPAPVPAVPGVMLALAPPTLPEPPFPVDGAAGTVSGALPDAGEGSDLGSVDAPRPVGLAGKPAVLPTLGHGVEGEADDARDTGDTPTVTAVPGESGIPVSGTATADAWPVGGGPSSHDLAYEDWLLASLDEAQAPSPDDQPWVDALVDAFVGPHTMVHVADPFPGGTVIDGPGLTADQPPGVGIDIAPGIPGVPSMDPPPADAALPVAPSQDERAEEGQAHGGWFPEGLCDGEVPPATGPDGGWFPDSVAAPALPTPVPFKLPVPLAPAAMPSADSTSVSSEPMPSLPVPAMARVAPTVRVTFAAPPRVGQACVPPALVEGGPMAGNRGTVIDDAAVIVAGGAVLASAFDMERAVAEVAAARVAARCTAVVPVGLVPSPVAARSALPAVATLGGMDCEVVEVGGPDAEPWDEGLFHAEAFFESPVRLFRPMGIPVRESLSHRVDAWLRGLPGR